MSSVTNNIPARRYELALEGGVAFADYTKQGNRLMITHVEVPGALQGQGIAATLMQEVVSDAKKQGLEIVPVCSYAAAYMKRHI